MIDPEIGFTSDVIKDPERFVGRIDLVRDCVHALNTPMGLIGLYGKRGVGKSSLLRQLQQMALGNYELAQRAGLHQEIPKHPRRYLTVYYACDSMIKNAEDLLSRICNDQNEEDGLLRLVPNDGKDVVEFTRTKEVHGAADLKVVNWGAKGVETSKYAKVVPDDIVQTFRNFVSAIVTHQVKKRMNRDGLLIMLDEFDVIGDKSNLGSLIKSLTSDSVKFVICGIGKDLHDIVIDHSSVERLLEEGALHVRPMSSAEAPQILTKAEELFKGAIKFELSVKTKIVELSQGFPYMVQLFGKECVRAANTRNTNLINEQILTEVLNAVKSGQAFPTLESQYQRAIGNSQERQTLLHLLAEQEDDKVSYLDEEGGRVVLKKIRAEVDYWNINYVDQLIPRLIDKNYGPVLSRASERPGVYEFVNPIFRIYVKLRHL